MHVTGDTLFEKNVIGKGVIQSKAIIADNLDVTSLSAVSGVIGKLETKSTGARMRIEDNLITAFDEENNERVKLGTW